MFHPTIKMLIIILIIIIVSIFVIFFSRPEEIYLPVFAEKIQHDLDVFGDYDDAIFKEFNLGEYYTKLGDFDKALYHYRNVYYNYPNFPKGYIKWSALQNMKQIDRVQEIIGEEAGIYTDTDILVKEYFRDIKR